MSTGIWSTTQKQGLLAVTVGTVNPGPLRITRVASRAVTIALQASGITKRNGDVASAIRAS